VGSGTRNDTTLSPTTLQQKDCRQAMWNQAVTRSHRRSDIVNTFHVFSNISCFERAAPESTQGVLFQLSTRKGATSSLHRRFGMSGRGVGGKGFAGTRGKLSATLAGIHQKYTSGAGVPVSASTAVLHRFYDNANIFLRIMLRTRCQSGSQMLTPNSKPWYVVY
jgi:hypothetical protein